MAKGLGRILSAYAFRTMAPNQIRLLPSSATVSADSICNTTTSQASSVTVPIAKRQQLVRITEVCLAIQGNWDGHCK